MTSTDVPPAPPVFFDAVLYPHRSLGRHGFSVLMGAVTAVSALVGGVFLVLGAWPVTGVFGLDVLLIYLAFRWNYRDGRRAEFVRLDKDGLRVRRVPPSGEAEEWRFEPHWVRVDMDDVPDHGSQLVLVSHGRRVTIGAFLSVDERLDLADALRGALRRCRETA